jgi:hypothetical protein
MEIHFYYKEIELHISGCYQTWFFVEHKNNKDDCSGMLLHVVWQADSMV